VRATGRDGRIVYPEFHSALDSLKNRKSNKAIVNIVEIVLAEGVVSEPLLPSGDQDHKGGFATLQRQPPIALGITNEIPYENRLYHGNLGCKAGRELGDFQELGTRPDKTKQAVLACLTPNLSHRFAVCTCG
jgi:hypothetical protein